MAVKLTNAIVTVTLESIFPNSPNNSSWVNRTYQISQFLTATANMQLIVETADYGPVFNIVEGGLDKFEVVEGPVGVNEINAENTLTAYPNPYNDIIRIDFNKANVTNASKLVITDMQGRIVAEEKINPSQQYIETGRGLSSGVYLAKILTNGVSSTPIRITKSN